MAYLGNTPTSQNFTSGTDYFNGNGSTVAFTLSRQVSSINDVIVVIENVVQKPLDAYAIVGTTLTFTSAPPSGTNNIYVRYVSTITTAITPNDLSVTTNKIADGVVTTAKVADNHITVAKLHTTVLQPANISDKENTSTGYFSLPSGTTAQRPGTPTGGMWRFNNTTNYNEYWDPTNSTWIPVAAAFTAIGGTVTNSGGYNYHTFTSSGTFQVIVGSKINAIAMVIASGGSGGGAGGTDGAGAGGAGGLVYATNVTFNTGAYAITVGAGAAGVGAGVRGTQGNNSSIGGTSVATAIGGGLGGAETGGARSGGAGGSGGGGGGHSEGNVGGAGTAGQGNSGATAQANNGGGGGGGAGAATTNRNGGNGLQYSTIATATNTGVNGYYAGGGGGSADPRASTTGGTGGLGGGGAGANAVSGGTPVNGTTNTGGGGGGSAGTTPVGSTKISGNGGSGLVIIAYPYP